jgi:hypothetical protein
MGQPGDHGLREGGEANGGEQEWGHPDGDSRQDYVIARILPRKD